MTSHVGQLLSPQGTVKYVTERESGVGWGGEEDTGGKHKLQVIIETRCSL